MTQVVAVPRIDIYWDEIAAFLTRRTGDATIAADLTQEAYLRAASLPASTAIVAPRAWLFATARNLLVDHVRRSRVRPQADAHDALLDLPDRQPGPDAMLLARQELAVLAHAVERLPPRTREVFRLHKFEGMTHAEIAVHLGIAKNTVMVHMVKGLGLCRKALDAHRADDFLAQDRS